MSRRSQWMAIIWVAVAVLLAVGSRVGGDASIVTGFLWLVWTAPVGLIWQFWIYDEVLRVLPASVANVGGLVVVLAVSYVFWFRLIPMLSRISPQKEGVRGTATDLVIFEPLGAALRPALSAEFLRQPRRRIVKEAREALGASVAEVADSIGFETSAIERAESEDAYLDTLPIQVLADLAARLQLPLHTLIA